MRTPPSRLALLAAPNPGAAPVRFPVPLPCGATWWPAVGVWLDYLEVLAVVGTITITGWFVPGAYRALGHVYLLALMLLCVRVSAGAVLTGAVVSAVAWNFVLVPPRLSFSVLDVNDVLMLGTYFAAALIGGQLMGRLRAQQRVAESDRLARALLDSVSHEFKTPLAVLRSATETLAVGASGRHARLVGEVCTATRRLERLVVNLLHQTRLEAGAVEPRFDYHDVADILAAARRDAEPALAKHRVSVEFAAGLPAMRMDGALMEHAIANLLLNVATHTPPGTPVMVRAGVTADGAWLFISVVDGGPGIPAAEREHVFRKFHRGADAGPGGAGLGLSIVSGFVRAHRGYVALDEPPGGGARFTLYVPAITPKSVPDE